MIRPGAIFLFIFLYSCKAPTFSQHVSEGEAAATTPMSCKIEGKVIAVSTDDKSDTGSICFKHPCRAKVQVLQVLGCGSSISLPINAGDTIEIKFAYTLHNTARIFPTMKTQYPGLERGDIFIANAEQRLAPGTNGGFTVFGYERK